MSTQRIADRERLHQRARRVGIFTHTRTRARAVLIAKGARTSFPRALFQLVCVCHQDAVPMPTSALQLAPASDASTCSAQCLSTNENRQKFENQ